MLIGNYSILMNKVVIDRRKARSYLLIHMYTREVHYRLTRSAENGPFLRTIFQIVQ